MVDVGMKDKGSKETRLAYKILDYVNEWIIEQAEQPNKACLIDDIKDVKAIAKIIEEFDGRETVDLYHTNGHKGYLRGIRRVTNE